MTQNVADTDPMQNVATSPENVAAVDRTNIGSVSVSYILRHGYIFGYEFTQKCSHLQKVTTFCGKAFLASFYGVATFLVVQYLFFLWFPLCRGEAGLFVTPMYGYFCNSFPLVPVVSLFSPLFFLLCLSQVSLHTILPS